MRCMKLNRGIVKEILVFISATLFFLTLCASIGVSRSARRAVPVVAASERECDTVDLSIEHSPIHVDY